jgi:glycosyltransferase involved in cell wall biosynthesis
MALQFFPRGGSSHVARNLARALPAAGWEVAVLSGSARPDGDARDFYRGLDLHELDMTAALTDRDPIAADPPLHASYEDRPGAPDRWMASLTDAEYEHHVAAWEEALTRAGAPEADVLHLHHLTPINAAAQRVAPDVPVVGHLHGTELEMLEDLPVGHPWRRRLADWAGRCERLIVLSDSQVERAERLLGIDPARCDRVPNGFDPAAFDRRPIAGEERRAFWRGALGSELAADEPVLLYVGRFTKVKRVGLLIEAHQRSGVRAPLVLVGGFPGEWEGEPPMETIERLGATGVHLAGWHSHDELPDFLNAADAVVLASVREQFGQVLVEAMACGLPVVAVDAHGPAEIVADGRTGWLVEPDDVDGLAAALASVAEDAAERRRRGEHAYEVARARYAWPALAEEVAGIYDAVREPLPA